MKIKASGVNQKIQSSKNDRAINFLCRFLLNTDNKVQCAIPSAPLAQAFQKISDPHEITTAPSSKRRFEMFLANLHLPTAEAHGMLFISLLLALLIFFYSLRMIGLISSLVYITRRAPTIFTRYSKASYRRFCFSSEQSRY